MAKYAGNWTSVTCTAIADTTALTNNNYAYDIQPSSAQRASVSEIFIGGEAASATQLVLKFARCSTASATLVAGTGGKAPVLLDPLSSTQSAPPLGGNSATTPPQRSATLHLLNFSFNAFGGIARWVASPGFEINAYGVAVNVGDLNLSGFTGTGAAATSGHILFEAM
jgi:hypothetical protein